MRSVATLLVAGLGSLGSAPAWAGPAGASVPGAAPAATAAATGGTPLAGDGGQKSDEARANQLATDIRVKATLAGQLAEQADAATIRASQVAGALSKARARSEGTDASLAAARSLLTDQAVAAYTSGGNTRLSPSARAADVTDPGLISAYGEIVAGTERDAIATYRQLRRQQAEEQAQLAAAVQESSDAAARLTAARSSAQGAADAEAATLAGIQGHLATLVAAAQAAQAQASATQVEATLARQGQAAAGPPLPSAAGSATTTTLPAPGLVRSGPGTTAAAPIRTPGGAPAAPPASGGPVGPSAGAGPDAPPAGGGARVPPAPATVPAAPPTLPAPPPTVAGRLPPVPAGAATAIAYARAQLGKPYQWGGAGPATFDCSGLVMQAWAAAGVSFPHLAQSQYDLTARVPVGSLQPGDLVFFGSPSAVYHVGIYIGAGQMIDAPATGQDVSIQGIYWSDLLGGGRVAG